MTRLRYGFKICLVLIVFIFVSFANNSRPDAASFQGLGDLAGGEFSSTAWDVSADGSVVVGGSRTDSGQEAFVWWDSKNGMKNLKDVLVNDFGLEESLADWTLIEATGISDDGLTIVGRGKNFETNSLGDTEAWIAQLATPIAIDIKPNCCPNRLNINKKKGKNILKVAILGTEYFKVNKINIPALKGGDIY